MKSKGAGYSLEAIVAVATVILFVLGGLSIPESQDWSSFRGEVASDDLTYALQKSGYVDHALSEGEIGSVQTAVSTVAEGNVEISGLVSNLPIAENRIAFYIRPKNRFDQQIREVGSSPTDECEGDLEEITNRSEAPVYRTTGGELANNYHDNETLYIADLDPRTVGGNDETDYDALWVDNGSRSCQFAEEDGPYYLDEIFKWENESYDFESVNEGEDEMRLYRSTQPVRFRKMLERPVNSVKTFVSIDAVNYTELESGDFDVGVVRGNDAVEQIDDGNKTEVKNFMSDSSMLVLANLTSDKFDSNDFMSQSGFRYVDEPYNNPYSGSGVEGSFSENRDSQDTRTYFKGLEGVESDLSISPPRVIADTQPTVESSPVLLKSSTESYSFSNWNRTNTSMENISRSEVEGEPESECYPQESSLTNGSLEFPDGNIYTFISAELGTSTSFCEENNVRGVKIDLSQDGSYVDETTLLNDQIVEVANREYAINTFSNSSVCGDGECVGFTYLGDRHVELISHRNSFPGYGGGRMAVSGYEKVYSDEDRKVLASVIHWLRGDQVSFEGLSPPGEISTSTISGIQDDTYLPYEVNMRWSR